MKKIALCFSLLALTACVKTPPNKIPDTTTTKPQGIVATHEEVSFTQRTLLTDTTANVEEPSMALIASMQELDEYIEKQKQTFDLTALEEEKASMDKNFFETQMLALAVVQGTEHAVKEVYINDGVLTVILHAVKQTEEKKTTQHILITMKKAEVPTSRTVISIAS